VAFSRFDHAKVLCYPGLDRDWSSVFHGKTLPSLRSLEIKQQNPGSFRIFDSTTVSFDIPNLQSAILTDVIPNLPTSHTLRTLKLQTGICYIQSLSKLLDILRGLPLLEVLGLECFMSKFLVSQIRSDLRVAYLGPTIQLAHLKEATISHDAVINISSFWSRIDAPSGVVLRFLLYGDEAVGVLDVVQRQARHPKYNTIQVKLINGFYDSSGDSVHICHTHNSDSSTVTHPGISMNSLTSSCARSILSNLPAYLNLDSIRHLHTEIKSLLITNEFTELFTSFRQFTSVTFFKLQMYHSEDLSALLGPRDASNVFLPNLHCLEFEILSSAVYGSAERYAEVWKGINDILDVRAQLGKPVHRLQLNGKWVLDECISTSIIDVDKTALARARSLVTELVDTRSFD